MWSQRQSSVRVFTMAIVWTYLQLVESSTHLCLLSTVEEFYYPAIYDYVFKADLSLRLIFNNYMFVSSPSLSYLLVHSRCRGFFFIFSLDHTQTHTTVGRTPLDEGSARRRDLYLTTQTLYKRPTSMPPVGFEATIPASARPQTYALDRAATGIGNNYN
jgi:hypothetical protein